MTREEAINIISQMIKDEEGFLSDNTVEAHKMAIEALEQEPKTGHWIRIAGGSRIDDYRCDCCNNNPPMKQIIKRGTWGWDFTDFCPNCGAKMKEGD